jgi:hypothetical protein
MYELLARLDRRAFPSIIFLIVLTGGVLARAEAATVTLQWESNRETDLAGYVIVYGAQSGQLTESVDVGNHTSYQFTNLETGHRYFFAVRAYNTARVMSAPSSEVSTIIGVASLSLTNLVANLHPPRPAGTSVIFAAAASGGTPPYQYKWFVSDGSTTTMVKGWSVDSTFTWQPLAPNANYAIKAWARNGTSTSDSLDNPAAERIFSFAILPADPTMINLVADREAPQSSGTQVVFTASASGGSATYEFQWSLYDGAAWKVLRDWSTNNKLAWSPAAPNPKYQVMVRVRGGQNLAANAGLAMPFPIQ